MNEDRIALSPEILVALVDRELSAEEASAVEAALLHDAAARETVRQLQVSAEIARRISFAPFDEPMPAALIETIKRGMRGRPAAPSVRNRVAWPLALAASIAALVAGVAGYTVHDLGGGSYTTASAPQSDGLTSAYEATLQGSLNSGAAAGQSFDYDSPGIGQGNITLGSRFTTSFGSTCREFLREETRGNTHMTGNGLACQALNGGWNIVFTRKAS
jgi:hypothetical protein